MVAKALPKPSSAQGVAKPQKKDYVKPEEKERHSIAIKVHMDAGLSAPQTHEKLKTVTPLRSIQRYMKSMREGKETTGKRAPGGGRKNKALPPRHWSMNARTVTA